MGRTGLSSRKSRLVFVHGLMMLGTPMYGTGSDGIGSLRLIIIIINRHFEIGGGGGEGILGYFAVRPFLTAGI